MGVCGSKRGGKQQQQQLRQQQQQRQRPQKYEQQQEKQQHQQQQEQQQHQQQQHLPPEGYTLRIARLGGSFSLDADRRASSIDLVGVISRSRSGSQMSVAHSLGGSSIHSTRGFPFDDDSDGGLSEDERSSAHEMTPKGETPSVVLSNDSVYTVSYSVIQEDKMRTTEHHERIARSANLRVKAGNSGGSVSAGVKKTTEEETTKMEDLRHFLLKDHRMAPLRSTQETKVLFPADCEELRVHASFKDRDGEWKQYKNKVYCTGRAKKKSFILKAFTSNIAPYSTAADDAQSSSRHLGIRELLGLTRDSDEENSPRSSTKGRLTPDNDGIRGWDTE